GKVFGAWRSLVARFVRDEEVAGSNPVAPTTPRMRGASMRRVVRLAVLVACAALACSRPQPPGEREVPVRVGRLALDRFHVPVGSLEEQGGRGRLPMWTGTAEASSIAAELEHQEPPRPNFHDLAKRLIQSVDAQVERVVVTELREGTYYATLALRTGRRVVEI